MDYGPISVKVNNKVEGLNYRVYHNKDVEFLDMRSASGSRAYTRTLFFVLCKAAHDVWPGAEVVIDIPVSNGYYCNINIGRPLTEADAGALRSRMQQIIDAAMPIRRHECTTEEAIGMFSEMGMDSKVKLLKSVGSLYTTTRLTVTRTTTTARCSPTRASCISSVLKNITTACCCAFLCAKTRQDLATL